jgi:hypothetical protein
MPSLGSDMAAPKAANGDRDGVDKHPEPLTPADCDLRDFPYMPLDVVRLRDSETAVILNGDEFRAAVILWCAAWHQVPAASLPKDDRLLASLAGYGRDLDGWLKVKEGALRGHVECSDGRLYHPVVAQKASEAWEKKWDRPDKAAERSEHARKAAAARWANRGDHAGAMPERMPKQCSADALRGEERKGEERKGEERKGEERKGEERKGKERKNGGGVVARCATLQNPRQGGHRFRGKATTQSDRKRPPNPNEGGHPVDGVIRGTLSAV